VPGSDKRQRTRLKPIRFTPEELARVEGDAERMGVTFGSYVRLRLLDAPIPRQSRRPPVERQLLGQALAQLGKAGSNLNQIARHLNSGGVPEAAAVPAALAELHDAKAVLMQALGRGGDDP